GADEYSFGTSLLLAEGCIMVRACHRDTCPVGIATQRPDLRAKFAGTPQQVAAYLNFVAEEVRQLLASLGLRSLEEAIGRVDLLRRRPLQGHRAEMLDLSLLVEAWEGPRHFVAAHPIQKPRSVLGDRVYDDAGKGMGGGRIVIVAPEDDAGDPYLIGNTCLYGATGGQLFVAGRAGERFCVRNSGATTVVEGAGDHACEYMTGGTVVILGPTGWNLGAGMTGGQAYVYDPELSLPAKVNPELASS